MKLLVTTGNLRNYLTPNFHKLLDELAKQMELTVCYQSGNIHDIVSQINSTPDFIFINEFGETNAPYITGLSDLTIPFAVALHDLHYQLDERKKALESERVKYIFSIYRDKFYEWYPKYWKRLYWIPHHFDPQVFKDYGLQKNIDYLMMGAVHPEIYPLRHKILKHMQRTPNFIYYPHPGYREFSPDDPALVGPKFAMEINRAKIFFTCDSVYHYPVAKYFEVLACKTLLLAPASRELTDLGFIPGVNFVSIDESNFEEKAEYYLRHEEERLQIATKGYEMVHARHTTARRAAEFADILETILRQEQQST